MEFRKWSRAEGKKNVRLRKGGYIAEVEYLGVILERGGELGSCDVQGRLGRIRTLNKVRTRWRVFTMNKTLVKGIIQHQRENEQRFVATYTKNSAPNRWSNFSMVMNSGQRI